MSAGTQCPQCARPLGFWTTCGAPVQRIVCPTCKANLRYAATGWFKLMYFVVLLVIGVLVYVMTGDSQRAFVLAIALIGSASLLEVPYAWYLRRRGQLEVRPATAVGTGTSRQ